MFYSKKKQSSKTPPTPIDELRTAVDRIHTLLEDTKSSYYQASSLPSQQQEQQESKQKQYGQPSKTTRLIPMEKLTEEELQELIRRVSELVVTGERYAANHWNAGVFESVNSSSSEKDTQKDEHERDNQKELQNHLAVFEYFCEHNVLGLMVDMITGEAFSKSVRLQRKPSQGSLKLDTSNTNDDDTNANKDSDEKEEEEEDILLLPPLSIATQGIQSVSILIQNVSRATSLYFLLSNHVLQQLIQFPLQQHYSNAFHASNTNNFTSTSMAPIDPSAAEMNELSTYFITFLKSLAMRMNAETLQFFLHYPESSVTSNSSTAASASSLNQADLIGEMGQVEFPLYTRALQFCSPYQDSFVRITAMNICLNTIRLCTVISNGQKEEDKDKEEDEEEDKEDSSSLPENDAEKEDLETSKDAEDPSDKSSSTSNDVKENESQLETEGIKYSSPKGTLVNVDLPTRERLAIAHHVCTPSRVQALVSPIFIQLTHLCGDLMEAMHDWNDLMSEELESNAGSIKDGVEGNSRNNNTEEEEAEEKRMRQQRQQERSKKMTSLMESAVADLQNELMFLDDLLEVGLTSLNEQTVEMMLATFIYPSLLQPLKVFLQRHPYNGKDESFYRESKMSRTDSSISLEKKEKGDRNEEEKSITSDASSNLVFPFPFKGLSNSLAQSGLLGDVVLVKKTEQSSNMEKDELVTTDMDNISPQNFAKEHSDSMMDNSPPKAALIALITVLVTLKNRRVVYFILTALFHPYAPNSSCGAILKQKPNVLEIVNEKEVRIKVDPKELDIQRLQTVIESFHDGTDNFDNDFLDENQEECVFSLSPALATIIKKGIHLDVQSESGLRKNPYREALLACMTGSDGMLSLRKLAIFVVDVALLALDGDSVDTIFFGRNDVKDDNVGKQGNNSSLGGNPDIFSTDKKNSGDSSDARLELMSSLCSSITTASICANGLWKLEYNPFVAHALTQLSSICVPLRQKMVNLIEFRRWQASSYISNLTSMIGATEQYSLGSNGSSSASKQEEDELCIVMDKIFRDPCEDSRKCVLDHLECDLENNKFLVEVSKSSCLGDSISFICNRKETSDPSIAENYDTLIRPAAFSVLAYLKLDSFYSTFCQDTKETNQNKSATFSSISIQNNSITPQICAGLLDENPKEALPLSKTPKAGTIVTLVGRSAFPCVCEVSAESAYLFKDATSSVVADGVKWQSLYLIAIGRYMVLAEPEKSTGGNGIIVTSCLLSNLTVQKDFIDPMNPSPARRLVLTHTSLSENPPGVFELETVPETISNQKKNQFYPHTYRNKIVEKDRNIQISQMDLWFEDVKAVDAAYQTLVARAFRARSRRGKILRNALNFDE